MVDLCHSPCTMHDLHMTNVNTIEDKRITPPPCHRDPGFIPLCDEGECIRAPCVWKRGVLCVVWCGVFFGVFCADERVVEPVCVSRGGTKTPSGPSR